MSNDLQLGDYADGYKFRLQCKACRYGWYEEPIDLIQHSAIHARMYLGEVEQALSCRACRKTTVKITPMIIKPTHHFVGGMG